MQDSERDRHRGRIAMRYVTLSMVACVTLVASACHRKRAPATGSADVRPADIQEISLERRPCFGTCPVYLVRVRQDGTLEFDGRRFVDSTGARTARLDLSRVEAMRAAIVDLQFFALDSQYVYQSAHCGNYATDAPVVITTVVTSTGTKRVEHDGGCQDVPPRLRQLEQRIDSLADVARFIGSPQRR